MLIPINKLPITKPVIGIIHVGAHECEERNAYIDFTNLDDSKIIWFEANPNKVRQSRILYPLVNIYNECLNDIDNTDVSFMITNNGESSSMLNFKTHLEEHPGVYETERINLKTKTMNTIFKENKLNHSDYNFMNFDIQGAELLALKGSTDILPYIDYIYIEVYINELYEKCSLLHEVDNFLLSHNFERKCIELTKHGWGDAFYVKK